MIHEVYYGLYHGPSLEGLVTALRWQESAVERSAQHTQTFHTYEDPMIVQITIDDGVGHCMFRFIVHAVRWLPGLGKNEVWIEVEFDGRRHNGNIPERWSGVYNFRTHKGSIVSERGQQDIDSLEISDSTTVGLLRAGGINTVVDLVVHPAIGLCAMLRPKRENKEDAVRVAVERFQALLSDLVSKDLRLRSRDHAPDQLMAMLMA